MVLPLLAAQFCFFLLIRVVPIDLSVNPFREQLTMGLQQGGWVAAVVLFLLLSVIFLLTAVTFVPVGQLCGRLMERRKKLRAYGLNLLGSLVGVVMMLVASLLWTPPLVWFAVCFLAIVLFYLRRPSSLVAGIVFSIVCTIVLAWWPIDPLWSRVYSPYQLVEIGTDSETGLTLIRAAGQYHQHIRDFTPSNSGAQSVRDYYDFPYKAHPVPNDVAIVGSGTGNDVAAALRANRGMSMPSRSTRSSCSVGRSAILRSPIRIHASASSSTMPAPSSASTTNTYDLIVYGLLDSHTCSATVRACGWIPSSIPIEGLREATQAAASQPDGMLALSFTVLSPEALGRKIFLMLQDAFDGQPPLRLASLGGNTTFADIERSETLEASGRLDVRRRSRQRGQVHQLRQLAGAGQRLHGRLAVLLHAAAHLSGLVRLIMIGS